MKQPRPENFYQDLNRVRKSVKIPDKKLEKILADQAADNGRLLDSEVPYQQAMAEGIEKSDQRLNAEIANREASREAAIAKSMAEIRAAREVADENRRAEIKAKFNIE